MSAPPGSRPTKAHQLHNPDSNAWACVERGELDESARAMGMTTIKVGDPAQAIADLEAVLGHPVR